MIGLIENEFKYKFIDMILKKYFNNSDKFERKKIIL